jgi:hypothetical protein
MHHKALQIGNGINRALDDEIPFPLFCDDSLVVVTGEDQEEVGRS